MEKLSETQRILIENINNQNTIFVFSTDVVKNSWIDWLVMNPEISGTNTVPLERFVAWDNFKGEFIKSSQEGKATVPSLMRKFFVRDLINQNRKNQIFKKIINPDYADSATSFTDWICKILPSLKLWHEKYEALILNGTKDAEIQKNDEENQDYLELYNRYNAFLEKNNMFEPSWIQPDFSGDTDKTFIIFYPEILEDYADYVEIFDSNKNIKTINLPPEAEDGSDSPKCYKYSDARQELRRTILRMRKLVHPQEFGEEKTENIRWDEIALAVPDLETYRPYLERELQKYNIPFVIRAGFPLTVNCAGQIFSDIYECYQSDFSYDSVRALVQNEYIPWKVKDAKDSNNLSTDYSILRENLIREGNRMRCICGYINEKGEKVDIWETALKNVSNDKHEYDFYKSLKKNIISICKAESFEKVHQAWKIFKDEFLDEGAYSKSANDILGHCITILNEMSQIEEKYSADNNFAIGNHFEFFLNELEGKNYTPQNKTVGLNVYPYKLSAPAKFKYQFVINASQKNLEVPYKRLSFLSTEKRQALGLIDEDKKFNASHSFIRLYSSNINDEVVIFSFCEESFDGFAIAHTFLKLENNPTANLDDYDFYLNEKKLILDSEKDSFSPESCKKYTFTQEQLQQFNKWSEINDKVSASYTASNEIKDKIKEKLITNRQEKDSTNLVFTQADMKQFFPCPRKWILSSVVRLKEDSLDTELMQPFDMGNINHKILENFMNYYCKNNIPLPITNENNEFENEDEIKKLIINIAKDVINNQTEFSNIPLVLTMLNSQITSLSEIIVNFLHRFCSQRTVKEKLSTRTATEGFGGYFVKGVEASRVLKGENYDLYGKIDLILTAPMESESTGWNIIDYKNSSIPSVKSIFVNDDRTLDNFQLPMYITLLTQNHPENGNFLSALEKIDYAGFEGIQSGSRSSGIDVDKSGHLANDYEVTMQEFTQYLKDFKTSVDKNDYEPKNFRTKNQSETGIRHHFDVDLIENCQICQFNSICRYNYTVGKREIKIVKNQGENNE